MTRAACPPGDHAVYWSQPRAETAALLQTWIATGCTSIMAFPCRDHWHIGHSSREAGDECKRKWPRDRDRAQT